MYYTETQIYYQIINEHATNTNICWIKRISIIIMYYKNTHFEILSSTDFRYKTKSLCRHSTGAVRVRCQLQWWWT